MVKPIVNQKKAKTKKEVIRGNALIEKIKADSKVRTLALQNTANKWAEKYNFSGDLSFKRVTESGKSFYLAVNGKELKRKYLAVGTADKPQFISSMALMNKN